jgi:ABC-type phosphate transport system substrate-binding protein
MISSTVLLQKTSCVLACALLCTLSCASTAARDLVVIVSAKRPATALSAPQVADIFLAQAERFPNGDNATPLDLSLDSPLRDQFYTRVAAKSPVLVRAYWTKMVFTGRGLPPREISSSVAMRKLVAANPSLIGYIDSSALDDSVQVVMTVAK